VIRTADLVISGNGDDACAAATDALRRGRRVLVVLRSGDARAARRLRRRFRGHATAGAGQAGVMTGAVVVCVDGVGGVEVVVLRYVRTGRLLAVNASAFLSCDGSAGSAQCGR
jgi:thioredoxin reductase